MQALMMTAIKKHELVEVPIPTIEKPDDVLLKVKSVGVCGSDLHGYTGHTGRRIPPLIMGHELTAEVVEVGDGVTNMPVGTLVAVEPVWFCGNCGQCMAGNRSICENRLIMGMSTPGAYAEYVKWSASGLHRLPDGLSTEHGALAEPLSIAVHAVGLAHIRPYDSAFIVGAGPIGLLTLAALRQTAVGQIIVSDTSDTRLEFARDMGADVTVNPARENVRAVVDAHTDGGGVDVSFEAVGYSATAQQTIEVTRNKGTVIWVGNSQLMIEIDMQAVVTRELKVLGSYGMTNAEFKRCLHMLADGQIPSDQLINRRVTLDAGPTLFDELLAAPEIIKCMINFSES
jgi:L-iditol 2-dehydrogenase